METPLLTVLSKVSTDVFGLILLSYDLVIIMFCLTPTAHMCATYTALLGWSSQKICKSKL